MRIVIAEDAAVLRDGLVELLTRRGHEVVATVADGDTLLTAVRDHRPDAAIVDIRMPPAHTDEGLRAAIDIRREHPEVGILVFSQHVETTYASRLLAGGAAGIGYLLKDRVADVTEFVTALERVAGGGTVLDPEVVTQLLRADAAADGIDELTPREHEVLVAMAEGRTNAAIARALFISERAVEKHVANIFVRFGLEPSADDNRRILAILRFLGV